MSSEPEEMLEQQGPHPPTAPQGQEATTEPSKSVINKESIFVGGSQMEGDEKTESDVRPTARSNTKGRRGMRKRGANGDNGLSLVESKSKLNNDKQPSSTEDGGISAPPGPKRPRRAQKKVVQNSTEESQSPLLTFLSSQGSADVAGVFLEHMASADGGGQAILNLRKVCKTTKILVDSLSPGQSKRIMFNIPIRLRPRMKALRSFRSPPSVSSLELKFDYGDLHMLKRKGYEYLKRTCPKFMNFWANQMQTLSIERYNDAFGPYCRELLEVFGQPIALRNLGCHRIDTARDEPSLRQLERVCFYDAHGIFVPDFYSYEFSSRAIVTVLMGSSGERHQMPWVDAALNSNLVNFEFDVRFTNPSYLGVSPTQSGKYPTYEQMKLYVSSVAQSTYSIRLSGLALDDTMIDRIEQDICPGNLSKKFFKTFKSLQLLRTTERVEGLFKEEVFQNLQTFEVGEMDATNLVVLREHFESILKHLPRNLMSLELRAVPQWTPEEWVKHLSVICERCPYLQTFAFGFSGCVVSTWKSIFEGLSEKLRLPDESFRCLKTLEVSCGVDEGPVLDDILFEILRIQHLPLARFKLKVIRAYPNEIMANIESGCMGRILASPVLCKSLTSISAIVGLPYDESFWKLITLVHENELQKEKASGKTWGLGYGFFWKNFSALHKNLPYYL